MTETTENEIPETPQPETPETESSAEAEAVQSDEAEARVAELEAEVGALKDRLLRTMAEMENLRKRAERDKQDAGKYGVTSFARELLNVSDNLRRALENLPEEDLSEGAKAFIEGVEMTERELLKSFETAGIKKIDPMGEKFDHNFHEAMFEAPIPGQPAGMVIQVVQAGYVIHDRLLRPARVGVSKAVDGAANVDTVA